VAELVAAVLSAQDKSAVQELVAMGAQSAVEEAAQLFFCKMFDHLN
jgi:hypothetical protein